MILEFWYSFIHRNRETNTSRQIDFTRVSPQGKEKGGIIPVTLQWNFLTWPIESNLRGGSDAEAAHHGPCAVLETLLTLWQSQEVV